MYVIPNCQTSPLKILVRDITRLVDTKGGEELNRKKVLGLEWNEAKTSGVEDEGSSGLIVGDASIWRLRGGKRVPYDVCTIRGGRRGENRDLQRAGHGKHAK